LHAKENDTFEAVRQYIGGQSQGYEVTIADLKGDGALT
jgi:hypothetical protein